jgi:hypothetical protein
VDSLISYLRKASDFGYNPDELSGSISQAYPDDMILVSDSEQNLQTLINRAKFFSILLI